MEILIQWYDKDASLTYMEAEDEVFNFKLDLRSFDYESNSFGAFFNKRSDVDKFLLSGEADESFQIAGNYPADTEPTIDINVVKDSANTVTVGSYFYLGTECLKVNFIDTSGSVYDVLNVTREQGVSTSEAWYNNQIGLNKIPTLGLECYLIDEVGDKVRWLYVKEIHTVGAGYEIIFDDVLNKYNKNLPLIDEFKTILEYKEMSFDNLASIMDKYKYNLISKGNYLQFKTYLGYALLYGEDNDFPQSIDLTKIFEVIRKVENQYIIFDKTALTYQFVGISNLDVLNATQSFNFSDKIMVDGGYNYVKAGIGSALKLSYKYRSGDKVYSGTITRSNADNLTGDLIEIDMSDYMFPTETASSDFAMNTFANDIFSSYRVMYTRVIGTLDIDIPYEDKDLEVGQWYQMLDFEKFDIIKDTSYTVYLFLISRDNDTCTFFVSQTEKSAFVGLALPIIKGSTDTELIVPSFYMDNVNNQPDSGIFTMFEDSYWHRRADGLDTEKWDNEYYELFDLIDMSSLTSSDIQITNLSLDADNQMVITINTSIVLDATKYYVLQMKSHKQAVEKYLNLNKGV